MYVLFFTQYHLHLHNNLIVCDYSEGIRETVFLTLFMTFMCYIGSGNRLPPQKSHQKGCFPDTPCIDTIVCCLYFCFKLFAFLL